MAATPIMDRYEEKSNMMDSMIHALLNRKIEEMPGLAFDCICGRRHAVDIDRLVVGNGILEELEVTLQSFREGSILLIADANTYNVLGNEVEGYLGEKGFRIRSYCFQKEDHALIPDERAIGRILMELQQDTSLILAVGSGVLNDLVRIVSFRVNKPFIIVGTAPSMDGYASVVSPLIIGGKKNTYPGKYPTAIFADTSVMKNAPMVMIRAGYGDVLGKLTALADWQLAKTVKGEYYCPVTAEFVRMGVDKCIESTDGLNGREEEAIRRLIEALILTGISMGLVGVSRPASGTEHQLAHYWEVRAIEAGIDHALHGNAVGTATIVTSMVYELADSFLPEGIPYPSTAYVKGLLEKTGAAVNPRDIGADRDLFIESMLNAMNMRDKYTLLRFCDERGKLQEFTDILTRRFYD